MNFPPKLFREKTIERLQQYKLSLIVYPPFTNIPIFNRVYFSRMQGLVGWQQLADRWK
jgi:hypothetical protein